MADELRGAGLAKTVADSLNGYGYADDIKAFVEEMGCRTHRTLQQSFTGLCVAWLKHLAGLEEGRYDLRNQDSVEFAKSIKDTLDKEPGFRFI